MCGLWAVEADRWLDSGVGAGLQATAACNSPLQLSILLRLEGFHSGRSYAFGTGTTFCAWHSPWQIHVRIGSQNCKF